jgi:hypothetical protein
VTPALCVWLLAGASDPIRLDVDIIVAGRAPGAVELSLRPLADEMAKLGYQSLLLRDHLKLELTVPGTGRLQLPGGAWLSVRTHDLQGSKLRMGIEIKELGFKTAVSVEKDAALVVRGPEQPDGTLVLRLRRK